MWFVCVYAWCVCVYVFDVCMCFGRVRVWCVFLCLGCVGDDTGQHMSGAGFPFTSYMEFVVHHVAIRALRILQWVLLCAQITASPDRKVCLFPSQYVL
jgi:hypothetical protein